MLGDNLKLYDYITGNTFGVGYNAYSSLGASHYRQRSSPSATAQIPVNKHAPIG